MPEGNTGSLSKQLRTARLNRLQEQRLFCVLKGSKPGDKPMSDYRAGVDLLEAWISPEDIID